MRIHRTDYTQKPTGGRIDWSRPDATGLSVFLPLWTPVEAGIVIRHDWLDLVSLTQIPRTTNNSSGLKAGRNGGIGPRHVNGSGSVITPCKSAWQTAPLTVGVQYASTNLSDGTCICTGGYYADDGEGGYYGAGWQLHIGTSSNLATMWHPDGWSTNYTTFSNHDNVPVNRPMWTWLTWSDASLRCYNRHGVAGTPVATQSTTATGGSLVVGAPTDGINPNGGPVYATLLQMRLYNRALKGEEIQDVIAEPWRIIEQPSSRRWFLPSSIASQKLRPVRDIVGA